MNVHTFSLNVLGRALRVDLAHDDHSGPPWETSCMHGPVRRITDRADKAPGERLIAEPDRNNFGYAYHVQAAMRRALAEGWGTADGRREGESARAYAARAVEADFKYLRGWVQDEWHYVVMTVTDEATGIYESLSGIDFSFLRTPVEDDWIMSNALDLAGSVVQDAFKFEREREEAAWQAIRSDLIPV